MISTIIMEIKELLPRFNYARQHQREEAVRLADALYRLKLASPHGTWERQAAALGLNPRTARRLVQVHARTLAEPNENRSVADKLSGTIGVAFGNPGETNGTRTPRASQIGHVSGTIGVSFGGGVDAGGGMVPAGEGVPGAFDPLPEGAALTRQPHPHPHSPQDDTGGAAGTDDPADPHGWGEPDDLDEWGDPDDPQDESRDVAAGRGNPADDFSGMPGGSPVGPEGEASVVEPPPPGAVTVPPAVPKPRGAAGQQLSLAELFEAARNAREELNAFLTRDDLDNQTKAAVIAEVRRVIGQAGEKSGMHRSETCATEWGEA